MSTWIAFSYSLPSKSSSSPRVTLWRRLKKLGAVSPTGSIYLLPAQEDCIESFQWLAQEVKDAGGEAMVMHIDEFEGWDEQDIIELFRQARLEDYAEVEEMLSPIANEVKKEKGDRTEQRQALQAIEKQYADVRRVDYFNTPEGQALGQRLVELAQQLREKSGHENSVPALDMKDYQGKAWVTRPNPHIDRLSSIWLIRRFVDAEAKIVYRKTAQKGEISFDMPDADFGHVGNLCTFEVMLASFGLQDAATKKLAEIIHTIDLQDGKYFHAEIAGIEAVLQGWRVSDLTSEELEERGLALFDGLYQNLKKSK